MHRNSIKIWAACAIAPDSRPRGSTLLEALGFVLSVLSSRLGGGTRGEEGIMRRRVRRSPLYAAALLLMVVGMLVVPRTADAATVFYATNRQDDGKSYGIKRGSHGEHGVSYAIFENGGEAKGSTKFRRLSRDEFFNQILHAVERNAHHECCVFVHGYNQNSRDACKHGQRLSEEFNEPIIVFDWISQHRINGYLQDECNAEWSLRHFQLVMQGLEKALSPSQIVMISHSMGNRLVTWYCDTRYDKSEEHPAHFNEIALTSPDVDRDTFKHYFFKLAANADKILIYVSRRDKALLASRVLHGYERVGESQGQPPITWTRPGVVEGMETIDFSCLDRGWMGHSIQYALIAKMHQHGVPGDGLQAVRDKDHKSFVRIMANIRE